MERRKRHRAVGLKPSSDYCRNCRIRRVKCDAQRPACRRCISAGRQCEFLMLAVSDNPSSSAIVLEEYRIGPPHHQQVIRQPTNVPGKYLPAQASRHVLQEYEYFQRCAIEAMKLQGDLYPPWIRYALQLSHEPALFYVMAAVGSAQRHSTKTSHTTLVRLVDTQANKHALKLYTSAVSHVQKLTNEASFSSDHIEPVLLFSLMAMVFEAIQGHILNAVRHVRLGRRIAHEHRSKVDADSDSVMTAIRIGLDLSGVDTMDSSFSRLSLGRQGPGRISSLLLKKRSGFRSIDEAAIHLEHLIERRHQIQSQLLQLAELAVDKLCPEAGQIDVSSRYCLIHTLSRSMDIEGDENLESNLFDLMSDHDSWMKDFELLLSTDLITGQTSLLMQIWFFISRFTLFQCRQVREMLSDRFENDCVRTLDIIDRFLKYRREPFETTYGPTTSSRCWHRAGIFEFGILPAIFTIASKCRASHVRWRAITMLNDAKREEATNDSASLALYAGAIARLEEGKVQAVSNLDPSSIQAFAANEVPEEARFLDVVISSEPRAVGDFNLVGTRLMHECQERKIELLAYRIKQSDSLGVNSTNAQSIGIIDRTTNIPSVDLYSRAELTVHAVA